MNQIFIIQTEINVNSVKCINIIIIVITGKSSKKIAIEQLRTIKIGKSVSLKNVAKYVVKIHNFF